MWGSHGVWIPQRWLCLRFNSKILLVRWWVVSSIILMVLILVVIVLTAVIVSFCFDLPLAILFHYFIIPTNISYFLESPVSRLMDESKQPTSHILNGHLIHLEHLLHEFFRCSDLLDNLPNKPEAVVEDKLVRSSDMLRTSLF